MQVTRSYHHHNGSIALVAMFNIGTDFTFRTKEFKDFADCALMSWAAWLQESKLVDDVNNEDLMSVPWVGLGEEYKTVAEAFAAARKSFKEDISLERMMWMSSASV